MLHVTWEWLGQGAALDLANTVAIVAGREHDLIADVDEHERWAAAESAALKLPERDADALIAARPQFLALRAPVRAVIEAAADGRELPQRAVSELNRTSRSAPSWLELDAQTRRPRSVSLADIADRLLADCARAAMLLVSDDAARRLRRCPAPSCGMFYRPGRSDQRWCSQQCGARARVARHYRAHKHP